VRVCDAENVQTVTAKRGKEKREKGKEEKRKKIFHSEKKIFFVFNTGILRGTTITKGCFKIKKKKIQKPTRARVIYVIYV
jgi:predicted phosphoribosyltransferase